MKKAEFNWIKFESNVKWCMLGYFFGGIAGVLVHGFLTGTL